MNFLNSTVVASPDEYDRFDINRTKDNENMSLLTIHAMEKMSDDAKKCDKSTVYGNTVNPQEDIKCTLEKIVDLTRMQHEYMKHALETQAMEVKNDIQNIRCQQGETSSSIAKAKEIINEMKQEVKLQHREMRRRFERVENNIRKGNFS